MMRGRHHLEDSVVPSCLAWMTLSLERELASPMLEMLLEPVSCCQASAFEMIESRVPLPSDSRFFPYS